jgi:hypothetical protein
MENVDTKDILSDTVDYASYFDNLNDDYIKIDTGYTQQNDYNKITMTEQP